MQWMIWWRKRSNTSLFIRVTIRKRKRKRGRERQARGKLMKSPLLKRTVKRKTNSSSRSSRSRKRRWSWVRALWIQFPMSVLATISWLSRLQRRARSDSPYNWFPLIHMSRLPATNTATNDILRWLPVGSSVRRAAIVTSPSCKHVFTQCWLQEDHLQQGLYQVRAGRAAAMVQYFFLHVEFLNRAPAKPDECLEACMEGCNQRPREWYHINHHEFVFRMELWGSIYVFMRICWDCLATERHPFE